jgi:hypothetical protein
MANGIPADLRDGSRFSGGAPSDMKAFSWHNESSERTAAGQVSLVNRRLSERFGFYDRAGFAAAVVQLHR